MDFKTLNRDNFMLYAMGNYTNPDCMGMGEFTEDLSKIKYVKRLLKRYRRSGNIRTILLLNHLMVLGNVFGRTPASRMLFHKLERDIHSPLKTALMYLDYIHEGMIFDGIVIADIPMDMKLAEVFRKTMTAFSQTALPSVFFAHNSRVRAWCSTSFYQSSVLTQAAFDATNFLDGFNLRMDVATQQLSGNLEYSGALRFSFINPLPDNNYKVFVQPFFQANSTVLGAPFVAHVLNSPTYPKTRESFWVRMGFMVTTTTTSVTGLVTNKPATLRLRAPAAGCRWKTKGGGVVTTNTASNLNSFATSLPTCDAWVHAQLNGTSVTVGGSAGIDFTRTNAGIFRAAFSHPTRFLSGEYVSVFTPEVKADSGYFAISCNSNGTTAAGISASQGGIRAWIFQTPVTNSGHTASNIDPPTGQMFINMAVFCFSTDSQLYSPTGATYSFVPGERGYGVTGATYNTHHFNSLSRRQATAYGTIVVPPRASNASPMNCYVENSYNVRRVTNNGPVYDVEFLKPMANNSYAVILSSEMEDIEVGNRVASPVEFSLNIVRRGSADQHKTTSKFRIEQYRQDAGSQWGLSFVPTQLGKTHRIHFIVFGGGTYGAE